VKFVLFGILVVCAFYIPNPFFFYYGRVALFCSAVFIILQMLMLVDFAHALNEGWVERYESTGKNQYIWFLTICSLICYSTSGVLTFLMYFYQMGPQSWTSPFFVSLNILLCLCITLLSIHPTVQNADRSTPIGLFQASFVTFYSTYLVFAGLMDDTDSSSLETTTLIMGSIFIVICVGYTAIRISGHEETYFGHEEDESSVNLTAVEMDDASEAKVEKIAVEKPAETEEKGPTSYNYSFFHLVFALGAAYVCMLMTSWATISNDTNNTLKIDSGQTSMWVKIITSWVVLTLYMWTVIAPIVCTSRKW